MERLQADGVLRLPDLRKLGGTGPRRVDVSRPCGQPALVECAASACEPLELALVEGQRESRLWREQLERYHYLGCRVPFGAQLRYWVRNRQRELACMLWTSPAWKMKPREVWIGWSDEQRQRNLQRIVNNGRFMILPWVRVKGLASKILALSAQRMPQHWQSHYGHRPLLLETLVDAHRFRGTCYRAANWIYVGQTTGRGRMDREHQADGQAIKDMYLYPLVRDAKQRLCSDSTQVIPFNLRGAGPHMPSRIPFAADHTMTAARRDLFSAAADAKGDLSFPATTYPISTPNPNGINRWDAFPGIVPRAVP